MNLLKKLKRRFWLPKINYVILFVNQIIEFGENYLATGVTKTQLKQLIKEDKNFKELTGGSGPIPSDWDEILTKFVEKTQSGINKITSGDIINGSIDLGYGLAGITFVTGKAIYNCWPEWLPPKNNTLSG